MPNHYDSSRGVNWGTRPPRERIAMICRMSWLHTAGSCCFLILTTAPAAEPEASIAKLLDVGWSITPRSRAAADEQWTEVERLAGGDLRAIKASWLVLMQQRRFDAALKRIDPAPPKSPHDLFSL